MTLIDLCEPLFQYVCFLNRIQRKGGQMEFSEVRQTVIDIFTAMRRESAGDPQLSAQYGKMELPLVFFVDSIISEAGWSVSAEWHQQRFAYDPSINEMAGDEKFFQLLDADLAERSQTAMERLVIYYTCMGLGFTGYFSGQPKVIRQKIDEIGLRIRDVFHSDPLQRVCPEAYFADTRNLIEPPARKLGVLAIAVVGLFMTLIVLNVIMYDVAFKDVRKVLDDIVQIGQKHEDALKINNTVSSPNEDQE